jgi:hypothetical protein
MSRLSVVESAPAGRAARGDRPIADYAAIGNTQSGALLATDGSRLLLPAALLFAQSQPLRCFV